MAKIAFRTTRFQTASRDKIEKMIAIVNEYQEQGLRLTARQLYYQFVSRDYIPNTPQSYKNLTGLLADARYAGLIDWDAIEDRGREASTPPEWDNISNLVDTACRAFRLPRWEGQENYVELWVEKQALAGVLEPLANRYHATLMVNKGYSSASAMFESSQRFIRNADSRNAVLLYLGDHDPSGEDMVRDIGDRLNEFSAAVTVHKIALTMTQIRKYRPPPNPAKTTDSRYQAYEDKHGTESWEVDALPPNVLSQLITSAFEDLIDLSLVNEIKEREEVMREQLFKAAKTIDKKAK